LRKWARAVQGTRGRRPVGAVGGALYVEVCGGGAPWSHGGTLEPWRPAAGT
jgi:hypothetical protein